MRSLSSSMIRTLPSMAACQAASGGFLQRGRSAHRRGELTVDLRARLRRIVGRKTIQHPAEAFLGEILVGILPDQDHRRVDTSAEALDLFPAEIAILGDVEGIVMDPALADLDDVGRTAHPARRGATDLDMCLLADRR